MEAIHCFQSSLQGLLKRLAKRVGLSCGKCQGCASDLKQCQQWTLHKLRRTYGTTLLRNGVDLKTFSIIWAMRTWLPRCATQGPLSACCLMATMRGPTRRDFLGRATAATATLILHSRSVPTFADDSHGVDPTVGLLAIDMHNHADVRMDRSSAPIFDEELSKQMGRSGFSAVASTFAVDAMPIRKEGDAYASYLRAMQSMDQQLAQNRMQRALTANDVRASHEAGLPIVVQSVEGAQFLEGHLDRIGEAFGRGLRHLQLLHEKEDVVAPLGDLNTAPQHLGGLTPFGAKVIRECNRLGLIVDLAHGSHQTVLGALEASRTPILISHTALTTTFSGQALSADMHNRLITKDHASFVAKADGVVGVWTHLCDDLQGYVRALRDMVDAIGVDHVGIGTDTDMTSGKGLPQTNRTFPDLKIGFFNSVSTEMQRHGFAESEIRKIAGENYLRVFEASSRQAD